MSRGQGKASRESGQVFQKTLLPAGEEPEREKLEEKDIEGREGLCQGPKDGQYRQAEGEANRQCEVSREEGPDPRRSWGQSAWLRDLQTGQSGSTI